MWRGGLAIVGATVASCVYCAAISLETTPFGLLVGPFAALSVVLFLVLESTCLMRFPKYLGFFLPAFVVVVVCLYEIWSLHLQVVAEGLSDGSGDLYLYFVECYGVALCFALAFLLLGWKGSCGKAKAKNVF